MNIMLTCVGRRNYLVEYFKDALSPDGKVIAVNSIENTSGMMAADIAVVSPPVNSKDYIDFLLEVSVKYEVKAVFSLFDIDLKFLSRAKQRFAEKGIILVVSNADVVDICNDKYRSYLWLKENQFNAPKTYLNISEVLQAIEENNIHFPVIIKPRFGMGSISTFKAEDEQELRFFYSYAEKQISRTYLSMLSDEYFENMVIVQEFIDGQEYGIDILNDLDGEYVSAAIKKKLAMRSGETDSAEIVEMPELIKIAKGIAQRLKHRGNLDIDLLTSKSGISYIIDMNPRFGGGYPFTHDAGNNYIKYLISNVENYHNNKNISFVSDNKHGKYVGCKGIKIYSRYVEL